MGVDRWHDVIKVWRMIVCLLPGHRRRFQDDRDGDTGIVIRRKGGHWYGRAGTARIGRVSLRPSGREPAC